MAFVDLNRETALNANLEGMSNAEVDDLSRTGVSHRRSNLIAVAILATMEKQGRTLAVVTRPYAYEHKVAEGRIVVPEGFVTDFASIPSLFRIIVTPFGRHAPAAVIHDYLYAVGQEGARRYADYMFREAMRDSGVSLLRRNLMFLVVRLFGARGYGLEADWSFIDHEYGEPINPPCDKPVTSWIPWREFRARVKADKKAIKQGPALPLSADPLTET